MRIYFATNRNPNDSNSPTDFGSHFSPKGLTDLRFGSAEVSGSDLDQYVLTVAPESLDVGLANAKINDFSDQILGSNAVSPQRLHIWFALSFSRLFSLTSISQCGQTFISRLLKKLSDSLYNSN